MAAEGETKNPQNPSKKSPRSAIRGAFLSPGFRSAAAMAGWDEEALLLVVEDTPVRESRHKKRPNLHQHKSPPTTNSNSLISRKRRSKRHQPLVLRLDDDDDDDEEATKKVPLVSKTKELDNVVVEKEESNKGLPCMDKLKEELSCAICLEICFEPSTTPCGHSFCKKCLKCAATKCGKRCPKCRQLISNGRACTVNTVLWNTIQLLFPEEVEARKNAAATNACGSESKRRSPDKGRNETRSSARTGSFRTATQESQEVETDRSTIGHARTGSFRTATQVARDMERDRSRVSGNIQRRERPGQAEDAALARRLQREEFMGAFNETSEQTRQTVYSARANLRAMASRVYHIRTRGRY